MSKGMSKVKRTFELKEKFKNVNKKDIITLYAEYQIDSDVEYWAMVKNLNKKLKASKLKLKT